MFVRPGWSYFFGAVPIVSLLRSWNKIFTVDAPTGADRATLSSSTPHSPVFHVAEDPLELRAVLGLRVTDFLRKRVPEGWESLVNKLPVTDWHGVVAVSRERGDETLGSVGMFTVHRSTAHSPQSSLSTGLRHLAFLQPDTACHRNFVVTVTLVSVEENWKILQNWD